MRRAPDWGGPKAGASLTEFRHVAGAVHLMQIKPGHNRCMPTRWTPHVTVAAIVERDARFLLVEEQTSFGLCLNNPAGHLEPGESLLQACAREALEETAHTFTPSALVGIYLAPQPAANGYTYLRFAFCGTLGAFDPARSLDTGIVRTLWLTLDELRASSARHRSPMVLQCALDYVSGQRFALDALHY